MKIADFGISKRILDPASSDFHTKIGTPGFCAPEVLGCLQSGQETSGYNNKVDMWSLGCVLFSLSTKEQEPFSTFDLVRYCDGALPFNHKNLPMSLDEIGIDLLKSLLSPNPRYRPNATDTLRHFWFTDNKSVIQQSPSPQPESAVQRKLAVQPEVPRLGPLPIVVAASYSNTGRNYNSFLQSTSSTQPTPLQSQLINLTMIQHTDPTRQEIISMNKDQPAGTLTTSMTPQTTTHSESAQIDEIRLGKLPNVFAQDQPAAQIRNSMTPNPKAPQTVRIVQSSGQTSPLDPQTSLESDTLALKESPQRPKQVDASHGNNVIGFQATTKPYDDSLESISDELAPFDLFVGM